MSELVTENKSAVIGPEISAENAKFKPKPFSNPYFAGIGLGLVLLASFVIMGRGLGASGAFSTAISAVIDWISPAHVASNHFYQHYLDNPASPMKDWLVFEVIGAAIGGFVSAMFANRFQPGIEKGPRASNRMRLILAFAGGSLMGFGAKLARGCTSGQALTGGALLSLGSWAFMFSVFGGAYLLAYFLRRQWR
jgi:hypothetical protein